MNSPPKYGKYEENSSSKYFPVLARVRIRAPHVLEQKLIPQEFFPAYIGFVPGGTLVNRGLKRHQVGARPTAGGTTNILEDPNLLKLKRLDSSCPFFLSDTSILGQWTQMLQMLCSQD